MLEDQAMAVRLAELAAAQGGRVYFVGGCVRDRLLDEPCKDYDVEVHGLSPQALAALLDRLGTRLAVGESFGIYKLKGCGLDIAMPRRERNRGAGHRDFEIDVDPWLGTYRAAQRRDFTVNAMMQDVLTGELLDPFRGEDDLRRGVLRHVNDESFQEDPLRVLRAAQFAARFGFTVAEETVALCRTMPLSALARERVFAELEKALRKAARPSVFFETLRQMEQLTDWFPELAALRGVRQNPVYHAEGDAYVHTMLVLDHAAGLRERTQDPVGFLLAALAHDFGKAVCTVEKDGVLRSVGHETEGAFLADRFLRRLTGEKARIYYVKNLVLYHMKPNQLAAEQASVKATNRLFDRSVDPEALVCLAAADAAGAIRQQPRRDADAFLRQRLSVFRAYMARPYVMGRDLIAAGVAPSARFSEYLVLAHKLRLAGVEKEQALRQTLALARASGDLPQSAAREEEKR